MVLPVVIKTEINQNPRVDVLLDEGLPYIFWHFQNRTSCSWCRLWPTWPFWRYWCGANPRLIINHSVYRFTFVNKLKPKKPPRRSEMRWTHSTIRSKLTPLELRDKLDRGGTITRRRRESHETRFGSDAFVVVGTTWYKIVRNETQLNVTGVTNPDIWPAYASSIRNGGVTGEQWHQIPSRGTATTVATGRGTTRNRNGNRSWNRGSSNNDNRSNFFRNSSRDKETSNVVHVSNVMINSIGRLNGSKATPRMIDCVLEGVGRGAKPFRIDPLADSGARRSIIGLNLCRKNAVTIDKDNQYELRAANNSNLRWTGTVNVKVNFEKFRKL